jgi:hypothetical protein
MKMTLKVRVLTLVATIALLGGTAFVASGSTGAYFSDTVLGGSIGGSIGTIVVTQDSPLLINFSNGLLPGTSQTVTVTYHNSGNSPEDVWLNFNNLTALSALNNLGRYGSVVISSGATPVFESWNLDDNSTRCGPFSNAIPTGTNSGCWPVPNQLLLASGVPSGQSGSFTFTFEYATALGNTPATAWNTWPLPGDSNTPSTTGDTYAACVAANITAGSCLDNQFTIVGTDGAGSGLPYQLIGTQVGITPGQSGSKF